jgi:hypothetical protein
MVYARQAKLTEILDPLPTKDDFEYLSSKVLGIFIVYGHDREG